MPELSDIDVQILNLIKANARMSYSEIANFVGISRVAVKKHMDALEKEGVILGYETKNVAPRRQDRISFFMDVITSIDKYDSVLEQLKSYPMLHQVYTTTGECRIHCVGATPNSNRLADICE